MQVKEMEARNLLVSLGFKHADDPVSWTHKRLTKVECIATPEAFREVLLSIARSVRP